MQCPSDRLRNLGISLEEPAKALGAYIPAVRSGNLVFVSGQLPLEQGRLMRCGTVGKDILMEDAGKAAERCFINALSALGTLGLDVDEVERVVKLTGYVQSTPDFHDQPLVVNGASDLCRKVFGPQGEHARAALGVISLPMNAPVELEVVFSIRAAS